MGDCYLASSTKLLALLGVGDDVLGVKVAILSSSVPTLLKNLLSRANFQENLRE